MIVIEAVMQTEVFANEGGAITIRQTDEREEYLIVIPLDRVGALCAALRLAAKAAREL